MSASELDRAIQANDLAEVKRLVEAGADLEDMADYDSTPLANAARLGRQEIVQYLLEAGADPTLGGCSSVLGNACGHGHWEICSILLDAGADPNDRDSEGATNLELAVWIGRADILKLLIERGADPAPLEEYLLAAMMKNSNGSHDEVISYLKQHEF